MLPLQRQLIVAFILSGFSVIVSLPCKKDFFLNHESRGDKARVSNFWSGSLMSTESISARYRSYLIINLDTDKNLFWPLNEISSFGISAVTSIS